MRRVAALLLVFVACGNDGAADPEAPPLPIPDASSPVVPPSDAKPPVPVPTPIVRAYAKGSYSTWDLINNGPFCVAAGDPAATTTTCPNSPTRYVSKSALGIYQDYGLVGVIIPQNWNDLDASTSAAGPIAWNDAALGTFLQAIDDARALGLEIVIELEASQDYAPAYLTSACGGAVACVSLTETVAALPTCGTTSLRPVHWDASFRTAKKRVLTELAGKLGSRLDFVAAISIPVANFRFSEMWVPHTKLASDLTCASGTVVPAGYDDVQQWLDAGYRGGDVDADGVSNNMKSAALEVLDTMAAAYPRQFLKLHMQPTDPRLDGARMNLATLVGDAGFTKYGDRFMVQIDSMRVNQASQPAASVPPGNSAAVRGVSDKNLLAFEWNYFNLHSRGFGMQMVAAAANGNRDGCRANTFVLLAGASCYEKSGAGNDFASLTATGRMQAASVFDALLSNAFSYGAVDSNGNPALTIGDTAATDGGGAYTFAPGGMHYVEVWRADAAIADFYPKLYCATVQMGGVSLGKNVRAAAPVPAGITCVPY